MEELKKLLEDASNTDSMYNAFKQDLEYLENFEVEMRGELNG